MLIVPLTQEYLVCGTTYKKSAQWGYGINRKCCEIKDIKMWGATYPNRGTTRILHA